MILLLPFRADRLLLSDGPVTSQENMFRRFTSLVLIEGSSFASLVIAIW